jgi:hypothetical protein
MERPQPSPASIFLALVEHEKRQARADFTALQPIT